MPINIKKLKERVNLITFAYQGEEMEVEYRPAAISNVEYFEQLESTEDPDANLLLQLQTAIVRWELVDENGTVLEPSAELIRTLERPFFLALIGAINEDLKRRFEAKKG